MNPSIPSADKSSIDRRVHFFVGGEEDVPFEKAGSSETTDHPKSFETLNDFISRMQALTLNSSKVPRDLLIETYRESFRGQKMRLCAWIGSCQMRLAPKSTDGFHWPYAGLCHEVRQSMDSQINDLRELEGFEGSPLDIFIHGNVDKVAFGMNLLLDKYNTSFILHLSQLVDLETHVGQGMLILDSFDQKDPVFMNTLKMARQDATDIIGKCEALSGDLKSDIRVFQDQMMHVSGEKKRDVFSSGKMDFPYLFKDEVFSISQDSPTQFRDIEILEKFYQKYHHIMLAHMSYFQSFLSRTIEIKLICQDYNAFIDTAITTYTKL